MHLARVRFSLLLGGAPALLVASAGAQPVPVRALTTPAAEYAEPFSSIVGVRELRDGRVLVSDSRDLVLLLLDAGLRQGTRLGREGTGPNEYRRPGGLVPIPGDTTWLEDGGNRRYLVIDPAGTLAGSAPMVAMKPQENVTYTLSVRAVDASGRFYVAMPTGLVGQATEAPILRYDRRSERYDTVARVPVPPRATPQLQQRRQQGGGGGGTSFGVTAPRPFTSQVAWAVAPDGAVAIASPEPYRVDWVLPDGRRVQGPAQQYVPVRVGEAEKEEWRQQMRARGGPRIQTRTADGRTTDRQLQIPEPDEWPERMPAFVQQQSLLVSPDGRLWVPRAMAARERTEQYDVFDRQGALVQRVTLPKGARVVGFGAGSIYVARRDEDDLQYLQRFPLRG